MLQIHDNRPIIDSIKFKDLSVGAVFCIRDRIFIKTDIYEGSDERCRANAVILDDSDCGEHAFITADEDVIEVQANLTINYFTNTPKWSF